MMFDLWLLGRSLANSSSDCGFKNPEVVCHEPRRCSFPSNPVEQILVPSTA